MFQKIQSKYKVANFTMAPVLAIVGAIATSVALILTSQQSRADNKPQVFACHIDTECTITKGECDCPVAINKHEQKNFTVALPTPQTCPTRCDYTKEFPKAEAICQKHRKCAIAERYIPPPTPAATPRPVKK